MFYLDSIYGYTRVGRFLSHVIRIAGYVSIAAPIFLIWKHCYDNAWHNWGLYILYTAIFIRLSSVIFVTLSVVWHIISGIAWLGFSEERRISIVAERAARRRERRQYRRKRRSQKRFVKRLLSNDKNTSVVPVQEAVPPAQRRYVYECDLPFNE